MMESISECMMWISVFLGILIQPLSPSDEMLQRESGEKGIARDDDVFPSNVKLESNNFASSATNYPPVHNRHLNSGGFCLRKLNEDSHDACARQVEICSIDERCASTKHYTVKIPDVIDGYKVTHIAPRAFADDQRIVAVEIGSNVCQIGRGAFCGCSNLVSVSMSDCAFYSMSIQSEAFCSCNRLTELKFPNGLKMVDRRAFAECHSLKDVKLPDSCGAMAEDAFWGCRSLQSAYIGFVGSCGEDRLLSAFFNCPALKTISVHPDNPAYAIHAGALYYKNMKAVVRCPPRLAGNVFVVRDGVKVVCPLAFEGCQFTEITLPDGLVGIGQGAFSDCKNLVSAVLPSSVVAIDDYAFWGDTNLMFVVIKAKKPLLGKNVFPVGTKIVTAGETKFN